MALTGTLPEGDVKARVVRGMFDAIAPRYDLVNRIMTFGMDVVWRRRAVASLSLPADSRVLDVACGTGDLCRELSRAGHDAVGIDLSFGMLAHARTTAPLVHGDGLHLPFTNGSFDGAVSGFALRNVVDLGALFDELARVVRPGGRVALLEVAEPPNRVLHWGHALYFGRVVPRIGALLSDADAYRYLPASVVYLPPPLELMAMLEKAGFKAVKRTLLSFGIAQRLTGTRSW